jgi:iron(III) transport system ATP-binding protein
MAAISIRGLSKSYAGTDGPAAISDLSLDIADGQFVTLLGPSGCGKTTTLRLIAGFIAPDAGTIHADERLVSSPGRVVPPEERGMGMVFQNWCGRTRPCTRTSSSACAAQSQGARGARPRG